MPIDIELEQIVVKPKEVSPIDTSLSPKPEVELKPEVESTEVPTSPTKEGEEVSESSGYSDFEDEAVEVDDGYSFKQEDPSGISESREDRPSLTLSDKDYNPNTPVLDIVMNSVLKDEVMMAKHFPRVQRILQAGEKVDMTIDEIIELSRYCMASAIHVPSTNNPVTGLLDNLFHHHNGTFFGAKVSRPKFSTGPEFDMTDVTSLEVSTSGGGVINFPLPNSGFRIRIEPFSVNERMKLEESIIHRISEIGRSTIGGGMLAFDAILIDVILDKILSNVTQHNIEGVEFLDKAGLRPYISDGDIRPIIAAMNSAMYLDGFDYNVPCPKCKDMTRMNLNVLRSMHIDHGKLSDAQLDQLLIPLKTTITPKKIRRYQESFTNHASSKEFKVNGDLYRVHLRRGNVDSKMKSFGLVFKLLEKLARDLVGQNGIKTNEDVDKRCIELLQRFWHLHYLPFVSRIDFVKGDITKTTANPEIILSLLSMLSTSDIDRDLAEYLTTFCYDNVVTFATHTPECPHCHHTTKDIRPYDPVIDFFIRHTSQTLATSIVAEVMIQS